MRRIYWLLFLVLATVSALKAQPEIIDLRDEGIPLFNYDLINIAADDSSLSRMLVNIIIPYDELQFLKVSDTLFQAEIEIDIMINNPEDEQVASKSYHEKIAANSFDQSISGQRLFHFHTNFDLPAAEYTFICEVTDLDSKKIGRQKQKIVLRKFDDLKLSLSDLQLKDRKVLRADELELIKANFPSQSADTLDYMAACFEIYSVNNTADFKVNYELTDFRGHEFQSGHFRYPKTGFRTHLYIPLLAKNLSLGSYLINLKVENGKDKIAVKNKFRTHLFSLPMSITNLNDAIEQLSYIASKKDLNRIKKAPENMKRKLFDEYWQKLDPTPGTPTNEMMDEYYRRIAFSNVHFSAFREGWKSDMGMVYILFGPPSDVERQPYNVVANPYGDREIYAYEYWIYYDINRRFIFVDYRGFGDYRLLNPNDIYIDR